MSYPFCRGGKASSNSASFRGPPGVKKRLKHSLKASPCSLSLFDWPGCLGQEKSSTAMGGIRSSTSRSGGRRLGAACAGPASPISFHRARSQILAEAAPPRVSRPMLWALSRYPMGKLGKHSRKRRLMLAAPPPQRSKGTCKHRSRPATGTRDGSPQLKSCRTKTVEPVCLSEEASEGLTQKCRPTRSARNVQTSLASRLDSPGRRGLAVER